LFTPNPYPASTNLGWLKIPFLRGLSDFGTRLGLGMRRPDHLRHTQTGEDEKLEGPASTYPVHFLKPRVALFSWRRQLLAAGEHFLRMNAWWSQPPEGLIRLAFVGGMIWAVGQSRHPPGIAYHGAEHKTINAYEPGPS